MKNKLLLYPFGFFYFVAGLMHFIRPELYLELIPPYYSYPEALNILAGVGEILIAILVVVPPRYRLTKQISFRALGSWMAVLMLLVFISSHLYFIKNGHCAGNLCLPAWIGWVRLVVIHPLLIWWSYAVGKIK